MKVIVVGPRRTPMTVMAAIQTCARVSECWNVSFIESARPFHGLVDSAGVGTRALGDA